MDMSLSDADGVQICQEIRRTVDDMPILAITSFPLRRYAAAVAQAGVQGIVAKLKFAHYCRCSKCVVSGHVYLPDELAETMPDLHFELPVQAHRRIVAETLGGQAVKPVLSDRETAIIARYARGQTTLQVGECLGLSGEHCQDLYQACHGEAWGENARSGNSPLADANHEAWCVI